MMGGINHKNQNQHFPTIFIVVRFTFLLVDLDELSKGAQFNASHSPIKDLVQSVVVGGKTFPVVKFFGLSPKVKEMMSSVSKLMNSVLLRQFWKENSDKALKLAEERAGRKVSLSVDDVEEMVWTPSNKQLRSLQTRFLSGAISFEEIDKVFRVFSEGNDLAKEIKLVTSQTGGQTQATEALIEARIEQIDQYYKLKNCINTAKRILEFKTSLRLTGNFQLVEDLCNQVCLSFKYLTSLVTILVLFHLFHSYVVTCRE